MTPLPDSNIPEMFDKTETDRQLLNVNLAGSQMLCQTILSHV